VTIRIGDGSMAKYEIIHVADNGSSVLSKSD
jgi:hypothetical protein